MIHSFKTLLQAKLWKGWHVYLSSLHTPTQANVNLGLYVKPTSQSSQRPITCKGSQKQNNPALKSGSIYKIVSFGYFFSDPPVYQSFHWLFSVVLYLMVLFSLQFTCVTKVFSFQVIFNKCKWSYVQQLPIKDGVPFLKESQY